MARAAAGARSSWPTTRKTGLAPPQLLYLRCWPRRCPAGLAAPAALPQPFRSCLRKPSILPTHPIHPLYLALTHSPPTQLHAYSQGTACPRESSCPSVLPSLPLLARCWASLLCAAPERVSLCAIDRLFIFSARPALHLSERIPHPPEKERQAGGSRTLKRECGGTVSVTQGSIIKVLAPCSLRGSNSRPFPDTDIQQ